MPPAELPILILLTVMATVVLVWFRSPGKWVDILLLVAVALTAVLLALVLLELNDRP